MQPNILIMMTDQQRFDSLKAYGASFAKTPNLDRLASEGVCFERCYVNNPICTPSRASLWTGKEVPGHSVFQVYDNLPKDEVLFSEHLQGLGYQTALIGKLHVSSVPEESEHRHPHDGFDVYEPCIECSAKMEAPYQSYAQWLKERDPDMYKQRLEHGRGIKHIPRELHFSHWATERAMAFMEETDSDKPFFCMMSLFEPHDPYDLYPPDMFDALDPDEIPSPTPANENEPSELKRERNRNYLGTVSEKSEAELKELRCGYHRAIAYTDQEVGRVISFLEEKGLRDNTLVIFLSDHGDMLGDHGLLGKGGYFYDPCVRVPLLMRWPDHLPTGAQTDALVQPHDLAATVLSAAGMPHNQLKNLIPAAKDLLPVAAGKEKEGHDTVICLYRDTGVDRNRQYPDPPLHCAMIRDDQWKLNVYHTRDGEQGELFDMLNDPMERHNLWNNPVAQEPQERLRNALEKWYQQYAQELAQGRRGTESRLTGTVPVNTT
jgi:arylsulfatase A-like enzyme